MFLGDSRRATKGPGILPLQHHGFAEQGLTFDMRACLLGVRVKARDGKSDGGLGVWRYDKRSVGDVAGFMLWDSKGTEKPEDGGRLMGTWREVFPAIADNGTSGTLNLAATCRKAPQPVFYPVRSVDASGSWLADNRFASKTFAYPPARILTTRDRFPKIVPGTRCLVMQGTDEAEQQELVMQCDPRLFAVNSPRGDPEFASLVFEPRGGSKSARAGGFGGFFPVKPDFAIPSATGIPLHAVWRHMIGIQVREEVNRAADVFWRNPGTMAQQLGDSGCGDVAGGLLYDPQIGPPTEAVPPPGTIKEPKGTAATLGYHRGGPFHVGRFRHGPSAAASEEPHTIGVDANGNVINAGHLDLNSLWIWDGQDSNANPNGPKAARCDGTFDFDGVNQDDPEGGPAKKSFLRKVEFVFDPRTFMRHRWMRRRLEHYGLYRWQVQDAIGDDEALPPGPGPTPRPISGPAQPFIPDGPQPGRPQEGRTVETGQPGPGRILKDRAPVAQVKGKSLAENWAERPP